MRAATRGQTRTTSESARQNVKQKVASTRGFFLRVSIFISWMGGIFSCVLFDDDTKSHLCSRFHLPSTDIFRSACLSRWALCPGTFFLSSSNLPLDNYLSGHLLKGTFFQSEASASYSFPSLLFQTLVV